MTSHPYSILIGLFFMTERLCRSAQSNTYEWFWSLKMASVTRKKRLGRVNLLRSWRAIRLASFPTAVWRRLSLIQAARVKKKCPRRSAHVFRTTQDSRKQKLKTFLFVCHAPGVGDLIYFVFPRWGPSTLFDDFSTPDPRAFDKRFGSLTQILAPCS